MNDDDLQSGVRAVLPSVVAQLERWIQIPSIAFPDFDQSPVLEMANTLVQAFQSVGVDARLQDIPGGSPAVVADIPAPPGAPTVLMYAHYDVQPAPPEQGWTTDPFTPNHIDGRLYGRGAADDKGGIAVHLTTLAAFGGRPPVGVKLVIEGDEEAGSSLEQYVESHPEQFAADVMLIADMGNLRHDEPVLTVALRGHVRVDVTVETLEHDVHSGLYGGAAPDALTTLIKLLSTLTDDCGSCAVDGLLSSEWAGASYDEELFRASAGMLDGVELIGEGSLSSRLWSRPAISVLGIDAPSVAEAGNVLHARASAAIGLRIPASVDPQQAAEALISHLHSRVPWGARLTAKASQSAPGFAQPAAGPAFVAMSSALALAYGSVPTTVGSGGSIPLLNALQKASSEAQFLLYGVEDADASHIHGPNESVDPAQIEKMAIAEVLLLEHLSS